MSEVDGFDAATQVYLPPRKAARRLVDEGIVRGLDEPTIDRLRDECWEGSEDQLEDAGLLGLLTIFYETNERGCRDGFVWHADEFWHDTDDAVAELAAALRDDRPLFRQERIEHLDAGVAVQLVRDDGVGRRVEAQSLADIVALFNEELRSRGRPRRLLSLATGGGWQMYVAVDLRLARKLVAEGVLSVDDIDQLGA